MCIFFFFLLFIDLARNKDLYCVWKRIKVEKTVKVVVTSRFKRMSEKKRMFQREKKMWG